MRVRSDKPLAVVAPSAWSGHLHGLHGQSGWATASARPSNPALKRLEFHRSGLWGAEREGERQKIQPMEIKNSLSKSAALRDMQAVNPDWMLKWIGEWMAADVTNERS